MTELEAAAAEYADLCVRGGRLYADVRDATSKLLRLKGELGELELAREKARERLVAAATPARDVDATPPPASRATEETP